MRASDPADAERCGCRSGAALYVHGAVAVRADVDDDLEEFMTELGALTTLAVGHLAPNVF